VWSGSTLEVLAIVVFTTWIAWPFLAPGGYVVDFDTAAYSGPNLEATYRAWGDGRLPWWEPGVFGGTAFSANLQTAVYYPLKVVFWPLGAPGAMGAMTATHLFMLAFGMRHLARRTLHLAAPAGLVAAVVMVGAGATMVRTVRFEQIAVMAWIPWLLVAVDAVMAAGPGRRSRAVAACAVVTALLVLSGHPQQIYLGAALTAAWVVGRLFDRRPRTGGAEPDRIAHKLGRVALAGGLGLGIAALPLLTSLPLFEVGALTPDALLDQAKLDSYVLDPRVAAPALLGDPWAPPRALSHPTPEAPVYLGAAAFALAVVGAVVALTRGRGSRFPIRATAAALIIAAVGSALLAVGPYLEVYQVAAATIPGLGQGRVPLRWLFLTTFVVAVLAAVGAHALRDHLLDRRRSVVVAIVAGLVALVLVATTPVAGADGAPLTSRLTWIAAVGLVAAAVLVALRRSNDRTRRNVLGLVAVAVVIVELGVPARHSYAQALRGPESFVAGSTSATSEFLAGQGARYLALGGSDANTSLTSGGRTLDGYDGGLWLTEPYVAAAEQLVDGPFDPLGRISDQIELPVDADALARLGVRYVVIDPHDHVVRTLGRPPEDDDELNAAREAMVPAWTGPVLVDGPREVWENPRFRSEAIVYPTAGGEAVAAEVNRRGPGEIDVVTTSDGGRLVVAEQAQPGWAVTVDGEGADLVEVDGFALGVELGPGTHEVELRYRPPGLALGLAVSLVSVAVGLGLALVGRRSRPATAAPDREPSSASPG